MVIKQVIMWLQFENFPTSFSIDFSDQKPAESRKQWSCDPRALRQS